MTQPSLEQYVADRYLKDLGNQSTGAAPACLNADEMIEDALKVMAALNKATQFIKQSVMQRQSAQ